MDTGLPIGKKLDGQRYTIKNVLGRGGFSITYIAENRMGKKFTIKEFFIEKYCTRKEDGSVRFDNLPAEKQEGFKKRFIKEGNLLLKIEKEKHPNIVKAIDLFAENNTHYLVLEYIEGRPLQTIVDDDGPLKWAEATNWIVQIGSALSVMHRNKLYHLDIKPANIIIEKNGQAVLIDFGLCKEVRHEKDREFTTPAYSGGYSPPEQELGNGRPDARTDIYALAATCYFMLTGTKPGRVEKNDYGIIPGNNGCIGNALKKAMAVNPGDRQQSVFQFLEDMKLDGAEETILKTPGRKTSADKPRKLNPALLPALAILILLALAYFGNKSSNMGGFFSSIFSPMPKDTLNSTITNGNSTPVKNPGSKEGYKKPLPTPEPSKPKPKPKPKYAYRYKGKIQRTTDKNQYHKIVLEYNFLNEKNEYGDRLIKGVCSVVDKANPGVWAKYNISGYVSEEDGTNELKFETESVLQNYNLDFCSFSGDFFYERGTDRIEARFQHGTGTAQRNSCSPYRTSSKFILNRIK
ncbi:MAG TPA: serine/threonine protein kinase [Bacteroidetes bacterium]|nr:serine/threonine protein kinase [Bacteroidota bacterium]